jgi:hypothetical protein
MSVMLIVMVAMIVSTLRRALRRTMVVTLAVFWYLCGWWSQWPCCPCAGGWCRWPCCPHAGGWHSQLAVSLAFVFSSMAVKFHLRTHAHARAPIRRKKDTHKQHYFHKVVSLLYAL